MSKRATRSLATLLAATACVVLPACGQRVDDTKAAGARPLLAPVATTATTAAVQPVTTPPGNAPRAAVLPADVAELQARRLSIPVDGVPATALIDTFGDGRSQGSHEALDIAAPMRTAVRAVEDGVLVKLFNSVRGGLTLYQFDPTSRFAYYYAHLDSYAPGLQEGQRVKRCDLIGFVGTSGNAAANAPHLHFAIFKLEPSRQWWRGAPLNPYTVMRASSPPSLACPLSGPQPGQPTT